MESAIKEDGRRAGGHALKWLRPSQNSASGAGATQREGRPTSTHQPTSSTTSKVRPTGPPPTSPPPPPTNPPPKPQKEGPLAHLNLLRIQMHSGFLSLIKPGWMKHVKTSGCSEIILTNKEEKKHFKTSGCPANDLVTNRSGTTSSDSKLERRRLLLRKIGCQVKTDLESWWLSLSVSFYGHGQVFFF